MGGSAEAGRVLICKQADACQLLLWQQARNN
jgi:hypothetical protein